MDDPSSLKPTIPYSIVPNFLNRGHIISLDTNFTTFVYYIKKRNYVQTILSLQRGQLPKVLTVLQNIIYINYILKKSVFFIIFVLFMEMCMYLRVCNFSS